MFSMIVLGRTMERLPTSAVLYIGTYKDDSMFYWESTDSGASLSVQMCKAQH